MTEIDKVESEMRDILTKAAKEPVPPQPASPRDYGVPNGDAAAIEMIERIKRVSETSIEEHYAAVDQLERMAKGARKTADEYAAQMRAFTEKQITFLLNFLTHCHATTELVAKHVDEFGVMMNRDVN